MIEKRYCPVCDGRSDGSQQIAEKNFSIGYFLLWCLLYGLGGLAYIGYYYSFKRYKCLKCGTTL